jgi:hypothetical protein
MGWARLLAMAGALYGLVAVAASWPLAACATTHLPPGFSDPAIHLWTMRWYRACLVEGRSPFFCSELLAPLGTPMGFLPPMVLQSAVYVVLTGLGLPDILSFNLIWFGAIVTTGLGVLVLAWWAVGDRGAAVLAGLLAMLSGPVQYFGRSELEQVTLVGFPLFLMAWIRLVDAPECGKRLAAAVGAYLLLAASAPYHPILGAMPAGLYVVWRMAGAGDWASRWRWVGERWRALGMFAGLVGVLVPVVFGVQVWAVVHGYRMERPAHEFAMYGCSAWSYVYPWSDRQLMRAVWPDFSNVPGVAGRVPAYLGVVTLGLMGYAAWARVRLARAGYWWLAFGMLVVLSFGAYWTVGPYRIPLPGEWIRRYGLIFRPLRVPGRFDLFAAVVGAVIAAAGFRALMERVGGRVWRWGAGLVLAGVAMADLIVFPYGAAEVPGMPECYRAIQARWPGARLMEAPYPSGPDLGFASVTAYWQSIHRMPTNQGQLAVAYPELANRMNPGSPVSRAQLEDPSYLANKGGALGGYDLTSGVGFADQVWAYLTHHGFDLLVVHKAPLGRALDPGVLERVRTRLVGSLVYEDGVAMVFERARMERPKEPVILCAEGWNERVRLREVSARLVGRRCRVVVYNPAADRPVRLAMEAGGYRRERVVRVVEEGSGRELARWVVQRGATGSYRSPLMALPEGWSGLVVEADGEDAPPGGRLALVPEHPTPISLTVSRVGIGTEAGGQSGLAGLSEGGVTATR